MEAVALALPPSSPALCRVRPKACSLILWEAISDL